MNVYFITMCSKEAVGKESEDKRVQATLSPEQDDISLFYSDIMPLLVSKFLCVEKLDSDQLLYISYKCICTSTLFHVR